MRHQLKAKTPSARARMSYILRTDRYGVKAEQVAELAAAGVANLPAWADGPAEFWSAVDGFERKNARLCLELELNLPRELSREGQVAAVGDYIDRLTTEAGAFPITWALHDSGDGNPHVHLMLQERTLDGRELDGPKAHFKRSNSKKPAAGGVAKSDWWHDRKHVFWSRALWADACNQQLLAEGQVARFDPRKKSERLDEALRAGDLRRAAELSTQTERHEGPAVASARRRLAAGRVQAADLPEQVMQIISGNDAARHYNGWLRDWSRSASDRELRLFLADHLHELHQTLEREMQGGHIQVRAAWLEQKHAEALAEDAERTAELGDFIQAEQAAQTAGLDLLESVQAAHIEALIESSERTELAELMEDERTEQALALEALAAEQSERARLGAQYQNLVSSGRRAGWLTDDSADELLYALIAPNTLEWLEDQVAELNAAEAEHAYRLWLAVQAAHAEALAEDAERTRLHRILASHMAKAWNEGALDRAVGQEILDNLGPGVPDLQDAVERVKSLRVEFFQAAYAEALIEDAERGRYTEPAPEQEPEPRPRGPRMG